MDYEEIQSSKFNAGILGTQRVHEALKLLNECKLNPLAWNVEHSDWNYNLMVRCIEDLYGEVEGFLIKKESEYCLEIQQKVNSLMKKYPIRENLKKPNLYNQKNYESILKAIQFYEKVVKRFGVKYKLLVAFEKHAGLI